MVEKKELVKQPLTPMWRNSNFHEGAKEVELKELH